MISFLVIFSLFFLPNIIQTSIPFLINPNCNQDLPQCNTPGYPALYYANHIVNNDAIHIIYSSLDALTISVFQTSKGHDPMFNYKALFSGDYRGAIKFTDTKPLNSFSLVLRRLIEFSDENDNGKMNDYNITAVYYLTNMTTNNVTFYNNVTYQPAFQFPLAMLNGSVDVSIIYPGETMRDSKLPKLRVTPTSFFVNIALKAFNVSSSNTRFAFELFQMLPDKDGSRMSSSRYIDDQYTPGIFNVWQLQTNGSLYPSSMLWKPVVYQSEERTIDETTLMQVYSLQNHVSLDDKIDQGIFYSILPYPTVSGFNISLGQAKDGFFVKENYTFIQLTAGLGYLEADSTKVFITIALITSLALPGLVGIIAFMFIVKRRFSQSSSSSYDPIDN